MPSIDRAVPVWRVPPPSFERSAASHVRLLARLSTGALLVLVALAGATGALTAARMATLRDDRYPALSDVRQLGALLFATHDALRFDVGAASDRADSLADEFHRVAGRAQRHESIRDAVRMAEGEFGAYYAQGQRRSAASGPSAAPGGLSEMTFRALRAQLDAVEGAERRRIDAANRSLGQVELAAGIAMALIALGAIVLLARTAASASRAAIVPIEQATQRAARLAGGDLEPAPSSAGHDEGSELQRALDRIADLLRGNRAAAERLAAGEYRLEANDQIPEDRTGRALARLAAYLDYLSIAAQRIAEGDLGAVVEPRSPADVLGQAQAAMIRRVVTLLRDADASARLVAATAADVQRVAAELMRTASEDAGSVGSAAAAVASIRSELQRSVTRTADVERRASETATAVHEGAGALEESLAALTGVGRRVGVVEQLSHDAGLIALNAGIEVGRAGPYGAGFVAIVDEVRSLAAQAGAAAREIGVLSTRGAEFTARSVTALARVLPVMTQSLAATRDLTASSTQRVAELTAVERDIGAARDARQRAATAVQALATTAEALAGQVARLEAAFAGLNVEMVDGDRETPNAAPPSARSTRETARRPVRRLALV